MVNIEIYIYFLNLLTIIKLTYRNKYINKPIINSITN